MLNRGENGKLKLDTNSLALFVIELYEKCNTAEEVEFVRDNLESITNCEAENRDEKIEEDGDNN